LTLQIEIKAKIKNNKKQKNTKKIIKNAENQTKT